MYDSFDFIFNISQFLYTMDNFITAKSMPQRVLCATNKRADLCCFSNISTQHCLTTIVNCGSTVLKSTECVTLEFISTVVFFYISTADKFITTKSILLSVSWIEINTLACLCCFWNSNVKYLNRVAFRIVVCSK